MPFISAAEAAVLVALSLHRRSALDGRPVNRVRVSDKTLREITRRRRLEGRFLEDFTEELLELGWVAVRTHSAWGFLRASAVMGWPRMNASRISNELEQMSMGDVRSVITSAQAELKSAHEDEADDDAAARSFSSEERAAA